jgi:hypothetical protein
MKFYTFKNVSPPGSGLRFWLITFLVLWGLGAIGLGWLVNTFFILIGLTIALPIVAILVLQWTVSRSLITSACPVCSTEFTAAKNSQVQCPGCGELLQVEQQKFVRPTMPGTIDVEVQAID